MVSISNWWSKANLLLKSIPHKALNTAYQSAVAIERIENEYFEGKIISSDVEGGQCVYEYYKGELDRELAIINVNLTQLKLGKFLNINANIDDSNQFGEQEVTANRDVLQKLRFIETVISKYRRQKEKAKLIPVRDSITAQNIESVPLINSINLDKNIQQSNDVLEDIETESERINPLRRKQYTPEYEQEVIQKLRRLRQDRKISIRILMILLIIPLLVQITTKQFIYAPLIDTKTVDQVQLSEIQISEELSENFLTEYHKLKDISDLKHILNPNYQSSEVEEEFQEQVREILLEAGYETRNGSVNLLADITALLIFVGIIYFRRRDCQTLISFLSYNFAGLNVVTKVFIFILFTDIFVGFHSAEGWEVLLVKLFEHFGIPENSNFNGIFIATVPVVLDSTFKLLIFNYFTRTSPASVAVLEKMNQ